MNTGFLTPQDKSAADLAFEALRFVGHSLIAVLLMAAVVAAITLTHPEVEAIAPKLLATALALLIPMAGGFVLAKARPDPIASHIWISGLLVFSVVCVWVLDLPTGPGLCEGCGAFEKLSRTFFNIANGSGLLGGDGLVAGTWIPASMIGYAAGAKLGLS